ncbi:MAG: class I SAM-dependent methyltransferase, partial [Casimicrobium sp.]
MSSPRESHSTAPNGSNGLNGSSGDSTSSTFDDWLATPLGVYVAAREQAIFDRVLPDLFGYYALQMGAASLPLLQASRIGHRFTMGWNTVAEFLAEPDQLPFQENQFDVIVMPHVLEFQGLPHEVLRDVFRILRPEGRLLLTGFNPFSLYGTKRFFGRDR